VLPLDFDNLSGVSVDDIYRESTSAFKLTEYFSEEVYKDLLVELSDNH
jgi:hypothetical protein